MWRVLTHERAPCKSLDEIETRWTLDRLLDANLALDIWDDLEHKLVKRAEAEARKI